LNERNLVSRANAVYNVATITACDAVGKRVCQQFTVLVFRISLDLSALANPIIKPTDAWHRQVVISQARLFNTFFVDTILAAITYT